MLPYLYGCCECIDEMIEYLPVDLVKHAPGFMGWKDTHLKYLGCNDNLATILALDNPEQIIGLSDRDLIDCTDESLLCHYRNDLLALSGQSVQYVHRSTSPYDGNSFNVLKKPLLNKQQKVMGVIFHCSPLSAVSRPPTLTSANKYKLSVREMECFYHFLKGKTLKEIAAILNLSKRTIESYYENIKSKFGCDTKTELIIEAVRQGYLSE